MLRTALTRSVGDVGRPVFLRFVLGGVLGALVLFAALLGLVGWLLINTALFELAWLDWAVDALGGVAAVILVVILYPGVVAAIAQFLAEPLAEQVERLHYPGLPPPRPLPLIKVIGSAISFLLTTLAVNLIVLPLYLIPGLNIPLFIAVNGYLVGREYFEAVAFRRFDTDRARSLRKTSGGRVFLSGALIAAGLTVPLLNLLMPVFGLLIMAHLVAQTARHAAGPPA